jgi:TolA-binding protein
MKKRIILSLVLVLAAVTAYGEQKDGFWDKLQNKLEKVTPVKKATSTTAVGGVRGAKNDDATDIYWKGKDKASDITEEELQKFSAAFESKKKGDNYLALKQLEEFLTAYPQSSLRGEGLQAVELIKAEINGAGSPPKAEPSAPKLPEAAPVPATPEAGKQ